MQHITIALPDELSAALAAPGQDLSRAAFEALALAAYRERKISTAQLRHLLGYETRMEVDAFLKEHGVELEYTQEELERDRKTHSRLGL
jgi:predicted HTH domain antitoxin